MTAQKNFRVDSFVAGLAVKAPVHTAALSNIATLSGLGQVINGYTVTDKDRILLTAQTDPIDNGIYSARGSAWIRDGDCDGNRDLVGGTLVPAWDQGTSKIILYVLGGAPDAKDIGVDSLTFTAYYTPA